MKKLPPDFKPFPIGIDDFKEIIDKGYYYVDKTLMIQELLTLKGKVNLFTRPRRFGKTLNLSMLKYFFEDCQIPSKNEEHKKLFYGLKIMEIKEAYEQYMCRYPVIHLTLKSAKQRNFQSAYAQLTDEISREFERHQYLLHSPALLRHKKERFLNIMEKNTDYDHYANSLKFLSDCIYEHTKKKPLVFIDEYDVPLEAAYSGGFYSEMIDFIRSLFESVLKNNLSLEFAVITGCLRISKESIFTGLNNLDIISIRNQEYSEHFGFLEKEVKEMLSFYGCETSYSKIKDWYDGYYFGNTNIYNPWSVIKFVKALTWNPSAKPEPYWANTSSNSIVKDVLVRTDISTKKQLERLIQGETILIQIMEELTYNDISNNKKNNKDNFWNFLFFTGYLTKVKELSGKELEKTQKQDFTELDADQIYALVKIPNREIRSIYKNVIREWFEEITINYQEELYTATLHGETEKMQASINYMLMQSISFYDSRESFYHGFMLGLYKNLECYHIKSNRESGAGRSDLIFYPENLEKPAIIMEFKHVSKPKQMENGCTRALQQIENEKYDYELADTGYKVLKYGICFCGKSCMVELGIK